MDSLRLLILAIVQGLAEVLPVSSSGHLTLVARLFPDDQISLPIVTLLHIGSLGAICFWFRADLWLLIRDFRAGARNITAWLRSGRPVPQKPEGRTVLGFGLGLIATGVVGYLFQPFVSEVLLTPQWVAGFLTINGLILLSGIRTQGEKRYTQLTPAQFLLLGLIQGLAVIPGISRLGLTLCAGLWLRLNWYQALKLSFLYAIPAIAEGNLLLLASVLDLFPTAPADRMVMLLSIVVVFALTLLGVAWLQRQVLERRTLLFFSLYCLVLQRDFDDKALSSSQRG